MKEKGKLVPYHKTNEDIYRQNKKGQSSFIKSILCRQMYGTNTTTMWGKFLKPLV